MNIIIDVLMGWIKNYNVLLRVVDYLAFVKGFLHPCNPKDLRTYMPIGWYIPMACQPLPLS
jgi:hypothetical protein